MKTRNGFNIVSVERYAKPKFIDAADGYSTWLEVEWQSITVEEVAVYNINNLDYKLEVTCHQCNYSVSLASLSEYKKLQKLVNIAKAGEEPLPF